MPARDLSIELNDSDSFTVHCNVEHGSLKVQIITNNHALTTIILTNNNNRESGY